MGDIPNLTEYKDGASHGNSEPFTDLTLPEFSAAASAMVSPTSTDASDMKCLVCDENSPSGDASYDLYSYQVAAQTKFLLSRKLQSLLGIDLATINVYSTVLCACCFNLIQDVQEMEQKIDGIKVNLSEKFTCTASKHGIKINECVSKIEMKTEHSNDEEINKGALSDSPSDTQEILPGSIDVEDGVVRKQPKRKSKSKLTSFMTNLSEAENPVPTTATSGSVNCLRSSAYSCPVCSKRFPRKPISRFTYHVRQKCGLKKSTVCSTCGKIFRDKEALADHHKLQSDKPTKEVTDNDNGESQEMDETDGFASASPVPESLDDNISDMHEDSTELDGKSARNSRSQKTWKCDMCDAVLTSLGRLEQHTLSKHSDCKSNPATETSSPTQNNRCKKCNKVVGKNDVHKCRVFVCEVCSETFKSKGPLNKHVLTHESYRPFECTQCPKTFQRKEYLTIHMRIHTDERPYSCEFCKRAFRSKSHYNNHRRTHTGQKPYVCQYCGKAFSMPQNLIPHLQTHTGRRPFQCDRCPKAFYNSGDLKKHERVHTGEKPYQCSLCGKCFASRANCQTHERIHTKTTKMWECNVCGKGYPRRAKLQAHMAMHEVPQEIIEIDPIDITEQVKVACQPAYFYEPDSILPTIEKTEPVHMPATDDMQSMYVVEVYQMPSATQ